MRDVVDGFDGVSDDLGGNVGAVTWAGDVHVSADNMCQKCETTDRIP
jgi:hypothetical protein